VPLVDVDPDDAGKILGVEGELGPVFAAVVVSLVGGGGAEREGETDDETEDGKKGGLYAN
jgi:hypothetical protein